MFSRSLWDTRRPADQGGRSQRPLFFSPGYRVPDAVRREAARCRAGTYARPQSRIELIRQISPIWIEPLNQLDLPGTTPSFEGVFTRARLQNGFEYLEVDQLIDVVLSCEPRDELRLVFSDSARKVIRHAYIEGPVSPAREDVNEELRVHLGADGCGKRPKFRKFREHCQFPWVPALRRTTACCDASGTREMSDFGIVHLHSGVKAAYL